MNPQKNSFHIALILIVSFSVTFLSMARYYFICQKESFQQKINPVLFVAKFQTDLDDAQQGEVENAIKAIPDISEIKIHRPEIPWSGPSEYAEEWNQMWNTHMAPILYATSAFQLDPSLQSPLIAQRIGTVSGVAQVTWDQKKIQDYAVTIRQWKNEQTFFSILSVLLMIALTFGLIVTYPSRSGSDRKSPMSFDRLDIRFDSEKNRKSMHLLPILFSMIVFCILFSLGYAFNPFPEPPSNRFGFWSYFFQGILIAGGWATVIVLIGSGLNSFPSSTASLKPLSHNQTPPPSEWSKE